MQIFHHGVSEYRADGSFGPAFLPNFDLLVVLSGKITFELPDVGLSVVEGDAIIVPPRTRFSGKTEEGFILWVHHFFPGSDKRMDWLHALPTGRLALYPGGVKGAWPRAMVRRIHDIHPLETHKLEQALLLGLLLEYLHSVPPQTFSLIDDVVEEARQKRWRRVNVAWMAARAGLSQSHFRARFFAERGQGAGNFLKEKRLERSKDMLSSTDIPIKEISLEIGYSEVSAFHHAFKSAYGYTPKEFREHYPNRV